jgi:exopolysaccharide biosynthesis polyprenyl glycosylphosphotransferase
VAVVHLPGDRRTWEDDAIRAETGSTSVLAVVDDGESAMAKSLDQVDVIYLSTSLPRERREVLLTAALAANKEVYLVPDLYDILLHNADRTRVGDKSVFHLEGLRLSPVQRVVKRLEDLLLAGVAALIGLTIFPPVAIAVWRSSPGPIFYRQERVGRNGRRFSIYKFRTMVADAERLTGPVLATENDPRITAVGRFLRATRLDELPQIINILRGEMSFVGPRPERPVFVEEFSARLPAYRCRLAVKPGLTGLAQVNGRYSTDAVDKLRYDLYYIRNYSPLLDLRIILQTVRTVLSPAAAAGLELSSRDDVAG